MNVIAGRGFKLVKKQVLANNAEDFYDSSVNDGYLI